MRHTGEPGWAAPIADMAAWPGGFTRCLYVHACCCLAAGDVAQKVGRDYCVDCCWGGICGIATCTNGLCWGPTRTQVRRSYGNVPGAQLVDIAVTTLLPCCYLAQALNHIDIFEERARRVGGAPPVALPVARPVAPPAQAVMAPSLVVRG